MVTFSRTATASRTGSGGAIVVDGVDEIVSSFLREADTVAPRAKSVVVEYAEKAAAKMRNIVPVDEGDVLDSITADDKATEDGPGYYADAGPDPRANKAAFVARFLEHGTVKMSPKPFVRPAGDAVSRSFQEAIKNLSKL